MGTAIFGLYAILFGALSVRHVSYAVVGVICLFGFEQWGTIYIPYIAANSTLVNIYILALAALAWFRLPAGTTFEVLQYPTRTLLLIFLFYTFVSTLWAPPDAKATARFLDHFHYLAIALVVVPLLIRTHADFTRVLNTVTWVGGSLVILFAFIPDFEGRSLLIDYDLGETLALPLGLGTFAGVVATIAFLRLRFNFLNLLWGLLVVGSALFLITKTGSRGQLLFVLATLFICFPLRWKKFSVSRFFAIVLLGVVAAGTVFVVVNTENTLSARIAKNAGGDGLGSMARVEMATIVFESWVTQPTKLMFGLGSSASWSRSLLDGGYSHVVPIEILAELGLFGFVLFGIAMLTLFLRAFTGKTRSQLSDEQTKNFAALFGCWVFMIFLSCKQGSLITSPDLFMYTALAEKCLRLGAVRRTSKATSKRRRNVTQTLRQRMPHSG